MPKKDAGASSLETSQPVEGVEHRLPIVNALWQPPLAQGPAEVAGIGGEHDVSRGEANSERLVTRRVAIGGQADNAAVAEQVVLAVGLDHLVPEVEIGSVVAVPCGDLGVHPRLPLASLNDHDRVGNQRVAADMVKMKMRVDDDVDLCRIAVDRFEPGANFLTRSVVKRKEAGHARSDPRGRVVLAIGMQSSVEEDRSLGVFDQISGNRQVGPTLSTFHQAAEILGQPATGQGEE